MNSGRSARPACGQAGSTRSRVGPTSSTRTEVAGSELTRLASTHPADPTPMMKSCASFRLSPRQDPSQQPNESFRAGTQNVAFRPMP